MSHCTNFKFQYTDRKLITQAFGNLGLAYKDSVVYSFSSAYTKSLGIDSYVSFYYNDGEFNIFIGIGLVDSIDKEENKLQIKVINIRQDYFEKFMHRKIKNIKIRPFANFKSIELLKENNNE